MKPEEIFMSKLNTSVTVKIFTVGTNEGRRSRSLTGKRNSQRHIHKTTWNFGRTGKLAKDVKNEKGTDTASK